MLKILLFPFCLLYSNNLYSPIPRDSIQLFFTNFKEISNTKKLAKVDDIIRKNIDILTHEADNLFEKPLYSISSKKTMPPSGDFHDYLSMAYYWWPDSSKSDGLPYIRKDGQRNPESLKIEDSRNLNIMISMVWKLSWAYFFTENEKYASKVAQILRFWFLNPSTRMNPNLNYAQFIPGIVEGRGSGIIDFHRLPFIIESIGLISCSKFLTSQDKIGLKNWFENYLDWLQNSKNGAKESKAKNNHGSYYNTQLAICALFTGNTHVADRTFQKSFDLISYQIDSEGKQPEELKRTLSFMYSSFNLQAWLLLANMAQTRGVDLWHYHSNDGRSLAKAISYLVPFATGTKKWEYNQIKPINTEGLFGLFVVASKKFNDNKYRNAALMIEGKEDVISKLIFR
ncbi:alginate lyase family protein [Arcicella sp. DC2W]|uniref:Alginate lyase family protein n=1 Tax=Arcicella gelida TaxID=2984195 RepID=A0ABU5S7V9_9BACT|nr:alginate lyase family protein [Arcicella sp. DC2W]MEA5404564.1 alginate lyase family protein [Arcicella sp. DC2W]